MTPIVTNNKTFQFSTVNDIVSKKLKDLQKSFSDQKSYDEDLSPLEFKKSPIGTPVNRKVFNFSDVKMMKVVRGGGGKEINSAQNYFFSKYSHAPEFKNSLKLNLLPINEEGKVNVERLKKDKFIQEMKILDSEDVLSSNNISLVNQNLPDVKNYDGNDKDPKEKGIFTMLNKLITK